MSSSSYPLNQFAPEYLSGVEIAPAADVGYEPRPYTYIYNPPNNELTAGQILQDSLSIEVDSDFLLFGWYLPLFTGQFQILIADSTGYNLMSGPLNSGAISQSSSAPTVFSPAHPFPAGGRIQIITLQDLSGAPNPLQIAFVGEKLFRVMRNGRRQ
jgi:hypothetical protein